MVTKVQRELRAIVKKTSREAIALKMGVTARTIERWLAGDNDPAYAARKLITQIYNGHKAKEQI